MRRTSVFSLILLLHLVALCHAQPAIAPEEGIKHIDWRNAAEHIGETVYVSGQIVRVGSAGRVNFLNFDNQRPPAFVGIVFRESLDRFPGELKDLYEGKTVRMRGRIITYQDRPQIVLTDSKQIEVLDALPEIPDDDAKEYVWPADKREITVATFNVLNLFDDVDDPYTSDEGTRTKPRSELEALAEAIRKVDADILALQEVENRGYLERFVDVFLGDMGYTAVHFEGNDLRGIDVALLTRLPVGPVTSHRHLKFHDAEGKTRRMNRDVITVTLQPPQSEPLEVWVVHLKSNYGGREFAEPVRVAEAKLLRNLLDERLAADREARILLTGDFNDTRDSETMRTILGEGSVAMTCPGADETDDSVIDTERPPRPPIDFITFSPALNEQYVDDSCQVMRAPEGMDGSDHDVVFARFRVD